MAKPPSGSSLLFGALADSGSIKQRKNGSYRMVLEGVDEIDWFTDRPDRVEGTWKPQKLLRKWDKYFASSKPNAQATVEVEDQRELFTFEMFKPKIKSTKIIFDLKPLSDSSNEKITKVANKAANNISIFIDNAVPSLPCSMSYGDLKNAQIPGSNLAAATLLNVNLNGADLSNSSLEFTNFEGSTLSNAILTNSQLDSSNFTAANLNGANLDGARLKGANLMFSNLTKADLTGADLTKAELSAARLIKSDLSGANLSGANLASAILDGAELTDAIWVNTICPDGTKNADTSPCTTEQLNLA